MILLPVVYINRSNLDCLCEACFHDILRVTALRSHYNIPVPYGQPTNCTCHIRKGNDINLSKVHKFWKTRVVIPTDFRFVENTPVPRD